MAFKFFELMFAQWNVAFEYVHSALEKTQLQVFILFQDILGSGLVASAQLAQQRHVFAFYNHGSYLIRIPNACCIYTA